ncbi:MAG TPA: ATP-dependent 6-phosphofructokinase [Steroidobacteraceae bacterium]|nr:ATP-dependent 6-phosphofructokinase [Steroidobacteraceae bacterium]
MNPQQPAEPMPRRTQPRVAVLTSGGDAPGMNAAIRAVARAGIARGYEVFGVRHGYTGLIAGDFMPLRLRDVGGIIDRGGTVLGTTRCMQMKTEAGQLAAVQRARSLDLDGLIVIGGNGSQAGALALCQRGLRVIGVASTIDNDLPGSDVTIGATTALDTALQAIDRLRVTASSHERAFLVEVMGRDSGHLALTVGIAGGAEAVVLPEVDTDPETIAAQLRAAHERGKSHAIVVVAEGARYNGDSLASHFKEHRERLGFELRVTKLGHIQRGGSPGVFDRILGSQLGAAAVEAMHAGKSGLLLGMVGGQVAATPLSALIGSTKALDPRLLELAPILAQ